MFNNQIDFHLLKPQPLMIVLSGPSGVGKDAVLKELQKRKLPLHFVVTVNSRAPRADEKEGVDYFFITREKFEQMIANDELIEYAKVYQDYKGVPKEQVQKALASGKDVILRLDVQGAARIKKLNPEAVLIFLVPTDAQEWFNRLQKRGTESAESFTVRIDTAQKELEYLPIFDYVVVNKEHYLKDAVDTVEEIVQAEHQKVQPRKINL
jgi:guanylate kinase